MPTSPARPSATARPTTPAVEVGCQQRQRGNQARRSHGIEPGADLEYHEQHRGKHRQAADQAPLRMQEQFVQPVTPAAALVRRAHARAGLEQGGGAVMAVGMQFLVQRPRQFGCGLAAQLLQLRQHLREVLRQFVVKKRIACGDLHQQQRVRHAECRVYLRAVQRLAQGLETVADMFARRLRQRAGGSAHGGHRGGEQVRDALAHQRHGGHHRHAQKLLQRLDVDVQALVPGFVHHVQRDHHGPAELRQFQRQLQMALQARGIDHLQDQVGWRERRRRAARLVQRYRRTLVSPQQIFQRRQIVVAQVMQGAYARQFDHACLVQADLDRAFFVGALRAGEPAAARRRARHRVEQRALARVRHADQGDAQAPLAAEQGCAQRHRRPAHRRALAAIALMRKPRRSVLSVHGATSVDADSCSRTRWM